VNRRWRTLRYGVAIAVAIVGGVCGATLPGALGGTLATMLIGIGLVGVISLIFYEVGLSEDRERAGHRSAAPPSPPAGEGARGLARPRPLDRRRGERRRLR
jgi:hypothetical protein